MINSNIHRSADNGRRYDSNDMTNYDENVHSRNHNIINNLAANDDNDSEDVSSWNYNLNYNFDNARIVKHGRHLDDWYIEFGYESYLQLKFRALLSYFHVYTMFRLLQFEQAHEYFCDSNWMWITDESVLMQYAVLHDLQIEERHRNLSDPSDLDSSYQAVQEDTIVLKNSRNAADLQSFHLLESKYMDSKQILAASEIIENPRNLNDSEDFLYPTQSDGPTKTSEEVLDSEEAEETNDIYLLSKKLLAKTNIRREKLEGYNASRRDLESLDDRLYSVHDKSTSSSENSSKYQALLNLLNLFADFKKSINSGYLQVSRLSFKSKDLMYLEYSETFKNSAELQHSSSSENTIDSEHSENSEHSEDLSSLENSIDSEHSASSEQSIDSEYSSHSENPTDSEHLTSSEDPADSEYSSDSKNPTDTEHTTSSEHSTDSKHSSKSQNSTDSEHSTSSEHSTDSEHPSNSGRNSQYSLSSENSAGLEYSVNPKGPVHSECLASVTRSESPGLSRNMETPEILQDSESYNFSTSFEETELFGERSRILIGSIDPMLPISSDDSEETSNSIDSTESDEIYPFLHSSTVNINVNEQEPESPQRLLDMINCEALANPENETNMEQIIALQHTTAWDDRLIMDDESYPEYFMCSQLSSSSGNSEQPLDADNLAHQAGPENPPALEPLNHGEGSNITNGLP